MRKTLFFLVLTTIIILSGCKKPDTEPSCKITSPKDGAEFSFNEDIIVAVKVENLKNIAVVSVYLDNNLCGSVTTEPYTVTISSKLLSPGKNTIKAIAVNNTGKQAEVSITVNIGSDGNEDESPDFVSFTNGIIPPSWKTSTWVIENTVSYDNDNYSLKSSPLDISNVLTYKTMNAPSYVEFYTREGNFDLYIDSEKANALSSAPAGANWKKWVYAFDRGRHSFRWETKGQVVFLDAIKFAAAVLPKVATSTKVTNITATSATSGGYVTDNGNHLITAKGVCWSTSQNPTINDNYTYDGLGTGSFTSYMAELKPNTLYYLRAYVTNAAGTAYGEQLSFSTLTSNLPQVITSNITDITVSSAYCGGNVASDGNNQITARGVCWSTVQNPTINDKKTVDGFGTGSFTSKITELTPNTVYFVRAYATNCEGTAYGEQSTFATLSGLPTVSTRDVTKITSSSAECGGSVTDAGNSSVTAKGVCWSVSQNPTINDSKTDNGDGFGGFTSQLTGLERNTKFYVRAYATNGYGTAYGEQRIFTTIKFMIGDDYQGGKIAYINNTGEHGFIVALSDQGTKVRWNNGNNITTEAQKTAIGTGKSNTDKIVQIQGQGYYAAQICVSSLHGGKNDWYLPSKDELNELYKERSVINANLGEYYWSSSEINSKNAWSQNLYYGYQYDESSYKEIELRVRCIRSF